MSGCVLCCIQATIDGAEEARRRRRIIQNSWLEILIDFQLLEAAHTKKRRFSELAVGKLEGRR
jgi:hypothetical protein